MAIDLCKPSAQLLAEWSAPRSDLSWAISTGYSPYLIMWALQAKRCFYCGDPMGPKVYNRQRNPNGWTRDHVLPASLGNPGFGNIVLAHSDCNIRKDATIPPREEVQRARDLWDAYWAIAYPRFVAAPVCLQEPLTFRQDA
jgi:5-methylcytosine-specific restriction endonuclease McrA